MNKEYAIKLSFFLEENPFYRIIKNDFYKISQRIKKIDKTLFLIYNSLQAQFEIHDLRTLDNTFVLSFESIDKQVIDVINKAKDRNTIAFVKEEARKRDRFNDQQQDMRVQQNKEFISRYQVETIIR